MLKHISAAATAAALTATPQANAFPIIGGNGLTPDAWAIVQYIQNNYPTVQSIGGVRADNLPDHPSGRAVDIMIGTNTNLGDQIYADMLTRTAQFNISYCLWRVPNHHNHIHCSVAF